MIPIVKWEVQHLAFSFQPLFKLFLLNGRTQLPKVSSCLLFHHSYFWASVRPGLTFHCMACLGALCLLRTHSDVSMSSKNWGSQQYCSVVFVIRYLCFLLIFIGDVVVSFLERKCDIFPFLTFSLLWKIGCLKCVYEFRIYTGLRGVIKGSNSEEVCPNSLPHFLICGKQKN